ncbi:MAG: single-stranded-DNA-specific exonuclease C-terminal domain-containing protein, partial [Culicoidibacterales bacterium]
LTLVDNQFDLLLQNIQKLEQVQPKSRSLDFDIHHLETKDFDILYAEMKKLAPFGNGMPAPIFHLSTSEHQVRLMGKNKEHVKLTLPNQMQLLFFNERDSWRITEQAQIHVVGSLSINRWQDSITYQSIVNDWWIDEIEFFYPNQVPITQNQHDEIVVIDHIPASNESFSTLKREIQAKGMCVLKWQDAQKEIMSVDDDVIRKVYKYFLQNKMVKIDQSLYILMKRNGIEKNTLNFAIKVFLELEFAIIREGVLEIQTVTAKKQLSDSNIYQKMKFQYQFVEQVVYASHQKRKELFEHLEE